MLPEQISAGARTVAHIADYFVELRQAAEQFLAERQASGRGYFLPGEDEQVRHLLVSYWQSRNALLELATVDLTLRVRDPITRSVMATQPELQPAAFLVAYAAAALLVDAARFLREAFEQLPIVRQKLNEPEPHFGIPAGVYDTVQHSLTSPRNAWHLYHALQYFDQHELELRDLATSDELRPVMAVIDQKGDRLRVAAADYAHTRLRVRAREALDAVRRDLAGQAMYGLQKLAGCLASEVKVRPKHKPHLPPAVREQILALSRPGDVFVTRKEYAVTNYFLPGYWPHAALYLGEAKELAALGLDAHENVQPRWERLLACSASEPQRVLESLKDGVRLRGADSPLSSDSVVVLRPQLPADEIAAALGRGMFHEGKPYDFDFDFSRSDRLVCTEVVYRSYDGIGPMRFQLTRRAGRMTLSAEDLIGLAVRGENFSPLAVYAPRLVNGVLEGEAARNFLAPRVSGI